mgnify:CR=1 FL=1
MSELPDKISVCSWCDKHTNDDLGETKWDNDADPYCKECSTLPCFEPHKELSWEEWQSPVDENIHTYMRRINE